MGQDTEGNLYRNGFKEFYYAQEGITSFNLNEETTIIYGDSSNSYAFRKCTGTLKTVNFPVGSKLEVIGKYSFYQCSKVDTFDLTNCVSLEKIDDNAFGLCYSLKTLIFPMNLKIVGGYVVTNTKISSITIPKSLTTIGAGAFSGNKQMQTVIFDKDTTIKEIVNCAFERNGLVSFDLPPSLEKIEAQAIWDNPDLKTITADNNKNYTVVNGCLLSKNGEKIIICPPSLTTGILTLPQGIKTIPIYSFLSCKAEEVILPESLETVDNFAFKKSEIKRITIPGKLTTLPPFMFFESKLEEITIPETVTVISEGVFSGCKNLKSINLPSSITSYAKRLFENTGLTSINIPSGVVEIKESCFLGCTDLEDIFIPGSVTYLGGGAFSKCPNINITFANDSPFTIDTQKLIMSRSGTQIIQFIGELPNTVITIASGVNTISEKSFYSKPNLIGVIFETDELEYIETSAFQECTHLKDFSFPKSIKEIQNYAFQKTNLTKLHFGPIIELIGSYSFMDCLSLTEVTFDDSDTLNMQIIGREAFHNSKNLCTIRFSNKLTELGLRVISNTQIESIVLPYTLTKLSEQTFANTNLRSITFRKSSELKEISALKNIPTKCFEESKNLEIFEFVDGIEVIGFFSFKNTALKEVRLPPSVINLKEECFSGCRFLEVLCSRDDETSLEFFEIGVVLDCPKLRYINFNNEHFVTNNSILFTSNLADIVAYPPASPTSFLCIPKEVQMIYPNVFYCCKNILRVEFPDDSNLQSIGFHSFYNCSNLRIINIPLKVDLVGAEAFALCDSLQCGLVISNPDIIDSLVNDGKMPIICTKECANTHMNRKYRLKNIILIFISILWI